MSRMQVMKYPVVKEPPSSLRQEVHTPSEPTEQEKLSHDSLLGDLGSSVPGGLKAALSRHPGLAFLEDRRAFSLKIREGCVQAFVYMDTRLGGCHGRAIT